MKTFLAALSLCSLCYFSIGQQPNGAIDDVKDLSSLITVPFTMPDGAELMTDIYLPMASDCLLVELEIPLPAQLGGTQTFGNIVLIPRGAQFLMYDSLAGEPNPNPFQLPAVFTRTPYGKDGDDLGRFVCLFGYAAVVQDMRGRYTSEGVYMPMYSDSWDKNPYHPNTKHILDITDFEDPRNGNRHEDGYHSVEFIVNDLVRDFGDLPHANNLMTNGNIAMFGASALGNTQYQAAAAHKIDPSKPGLKALFPIVATLEHYRYTGFQNGVFRDRIVTGWLKGQIFTGIDDDLLPIDSDINNNIHTSFDYGLPNKFMAARLAIDHFVQVEYGESPAGYYPNSDGRADMDASAAPVDEFGEGNKEGQYSRYTNMDVPGYHLTGWWDIFTDGQIETWKNMRDHISPKNANLQKLIIGPWAHQTVGQQESGDAVYHKNVTNILKVNLEEFNTDSIPIGEMLQSEVISWFRYNLNYLEGQELREPKFIIREATEWQKIGDFLEIKVPNKDFSLPFEDLINFITGNSTLPDLPITVRETIFNQELAFDVPVPELGPLIEDFDIDAASAIPFLDYTEVPNIRFYVVGPLDDQIVKNQHMGNYWFAADDFPLTEDISWSDYYLHQNGTLNQTAPEMDEGYSTYVHDPDDPILTIGGANMIVRTPQGDRDSQGQMNLAAPEFAPYTMDRQGVVTFETDVLQDSLCIIGFPQATLYAKSNPAGANDGDPTDTDFMVRIADVYPDGREMFVVEGVVNARAREYAQHIAQTGSEDVNIPFSNIESGKLYEFVFQMMPIAYTFGSGHKVKVLISSSNYTRYQVNPNLPLEPGSFFRRKPGDGKTYEFEGVEMSPRVAVQRIHFSEEHPSHLSFPIYKSSAPVGNLSSTVTEELSISVYPNPSKGKFTVELTQPGTYFFSIRDISGKIIRRGQMNEQADLDLSALRSGVYLLEIRDDQVNISGTHKLIIQ